jgi:hypothetical protein
MVPRTARDGTVIHGLLTVLDNKAHVGARFTVALR